jgi:TolB protein
MNVARAILPLLLAVFVAAPTLAQTRDVRIDLSGGGRRIPVHLESMSPAGDRTAKVMGAQADEVLARDLEESAVFAVTRSWQGQQAANVDAVITGRWTVNGGQVSLSGDVRDFPDRKPILARDYRGSLGNWRDVVHQYADDIVLQFTGEQGIARTRIAFSAVEGRNKELCVMDLDGSGLRPITADHSIALSPAWSPEGSLLLFSSYRGGAGSRLFVTPSAGGKISLVSGRPGLNTSPSYSPDGRNIACTLSMDGNAEIYVLDARGGSPARLTNNRAIDTSPSWSPTGQEIAFTSDRSGNPQVYVMGRDGANVHRLTFEVNYTDSPNWSPKGDLIAFVARTGGGFDIYICGADGTNARLVVSGSSNENPRWSPDGRHLVFASNREGPYALYVTDLDGRAPRRLDTGGRRAVSPAWSPRPPGTGSASPSNPARSNPGGTP